MIASVFQKYSENFVFQLFIILQQFTREICYFLKKVVYFLTVSIVFSVYKQNFTAQQLKKLEHLRMRKFQCLLFVLKPSLFVII